MLTTPSESCSTTSVHGLRRKTSFETNFSMVFTIHGRILPLSELFLLVVAFVGLSMSRSVDAQSPATGNDPQDYAPELLKRQFLREAECNGHGFQSRESFASLMCFFPPAAKHLSQINFAISANTSPTRKRGNLTKML